MLVRFAVDYQQKMIIRQKNQTFFGIIFIKCEDLLLLCVLNSLLLNLFVVFKFGMTK